MWIVIIFFIAFSIGLLIGLIVGYEQGASATERRWSKAVIRKTAADQRWEVETQNAAPTAKIASLDG